MNWFSEQFNDLFIKSVPERIRIFERIGQLIISITRYKDATYRCKRTCRVTENTQTKNPHGLCSQYAMYTISTLLRVCNNSVGKCINK